MASYRNYYCYKCSEYYPSHAASCYPSSSLSEVSLKVVVDTSYLTDADGTKVTSACGEGRIYDRAYVIILNSFILCQNYMYMMFHLVLPLPHFKRCIVLFAITEGWLLLDICIVLAFCSNQLWWIHMVYNIRYRNECRLLKCIPHF